MGLVVFLETEKLPQLNIKDMNKMRNTFFASALAVALLATPALAAGPHTLDISAGATFSKDMEDTVNLPEVGVAYTYGMPTGFNVGAALSVSQANNAPYALESAVEGRMGYNYKLSVVTLGAKAGLGYRMASELDATGAQSDGHPFYAGYLSADVDLNNAITLNLVNYRYRNSFDTDRYAYESHLVGTGVTFNVAEGRAFYVAYGHEFGKDNGANDTNSVTAGFKLGF